MELFIEKESSPKADKIAEELGWERGSDYPVWGHTEIYLKTISKVIFLFSLFLIMMSYLNGSQKRLNC